MREKGEWSRNNTWRNKSLKNFEFSLRGEKTKCTDPGNTSNSQAKY